MRLSLSLLRSAILLAAVVVAGCDRGVDSLDGPVVLLTRPNALIVPTGYSDVSVGDSYACAVRAVDGGLVCWGDDKNRTNSPPAGKYRQVSAGLGHACALRTDYTVICWGGFGFVPSENAPPAITYSQVSAGNVYGCGLRMDNRAVACWGGNSDALTGIPTVGFTQLSAGDLHTCGVGFGTSKVTCWGKNGRGQTSVPEGVYSQVDVGGNYTCAVRSTGTLACWGSDDYKQSSVPAGTYTQVSAGYETTCAIRASDRGIACWGWSSGGVTTPPAGAYTKVSVGSDNACAIRTVDLALVCWGYNDHGQSSPPGISTARALPTASFSTALSVYALDTIVLNLYAARVGSYSQAKFTYRFDCGDGKGYGAVQTLIYAKCPTRVAGTRTVRGKVTDQDGDTASYSQTVTVKLRPQTVSFATTAPTSGTIGGTYTTSGKSTSGLPVWVHPLNGICTMSGNVFTFATIGTCTIIADQAGDSTYASARATQSIRMFYAYSGFFLPVRNTPTLNLIPAGTYVQIPFSLGGNRGSNPVASTTTMVMNCDPYAARAAVEYTRTGTPGVVYDATTARYVVTWKAETSYAGSCRSVTITLADGTTHSVRFKVN
jgi:hypothetical protein